MNIRSVSVTFAAVVVLALVSWLGDGPTVLSQGTEVRVGEANAVVGRQTVVPLNAVDIPEAGLASWLIQVEYDADVVLVIECQALMPDAEQQSCTPNPQEPLIELAGTSEAMLSGTFPLGQITFGCVDAGLSELHINVGALLDPVPDIIPAKLIAGTIQCSDAVPPPSPTEAGSPTATASEMPVSPTPTVPEPPEETDTATPTQEPMRNGDLNKDGRTNSLDALLVLQFAAGTLEALPNGPNADVNGDGSVDPIDSALMLQLDAGFIGRLPVG